MEQTHQDTTEKFHEEKAAVEAGAVVAQPQPAQNPYAIPGAIVIAGLIIAGAVVFNGQTAGTIVPKDGAAQAAGTAQENDNAPDQMRAVDGSDFIIGNPNAKVKIVTFSDLECPFCKRFHFTMKEIMQQYGPSGDVAWVFRHFPLDSLHSQARPESIAAECVGRLKGNDAFWKYLDAVFEETPSNDGLDMALLDTFAATLEVDTGAFTVCRAAEDAASAVEADFQDAIASGGTGTPYSVIIAADGSRTPFSGAQPKANIERAITQALGK